MARKSWVTEFQEELDTLFEFTDLPERVADILQKYPHTGPVKENAVQATMTDSILQVVHEAERIVASREDPKYIYPDRPRINWEAGTAIPEKAKERFREHFPTGYCR